MMWAIITSAIIRRMPDHADGRSMIFLGSYKSFSHAESSHSAERRKTTHLLSHKRAVESEQSAHGVKPKREQRGDVDQ